VVRLYGWVIYEWFFGRRGWLVVQELGIFVDGIFDGEEVGRLGGGVGKCEAVLNMEG